MSEHDSHNQHPLTPINNPSADLDEKGEPRWKRKKPVDRTNAGTRPHRCAIRYTDFLSSFSTVSPTKIFDRWQLFYRCMKSESGAEPRDAVLYLDADTYEFYKEMQHKRRIRDKFVEESSPFESFDHEVFVPPRQQDLDRKKAEEERRRAREE